MDKLKMRLKALTWLLAALGIFIFIIIRFFGKEKIPPQLPLWYSRPWGEAQLVHPNLLAVVPIFGLMVAFITNTLATRIKFKELWALLFGWSGIAVIAILDLVMIRIWTLVF